MCSGGGDGPDGDPGLGMEGEDTAHGEEADVDDPGVGPMGPGGIGAGTGPGSISAAISAGVNAQGSGSAPGANTGGGGGGGQGVAPGEVEEALAMEDQGVLSGVVGITSTDVDPETLEETTVQVAMPSVPEAQQHANLNAIMDDMAFNVNVMGMTQAEAQAIANTALDQNITEGGIGSFSPGVGLGVNSEMGTATLEDIEALNAPGLPGSTVGYAINDPTGNTPGAIAASQIAAQQNPSLANAMFAATPVLGTIAGAIEGRGTMAALGLTEGGRGAIAGAIAGVANSIGIDQVGASVMGQNSDDDPGEIGGPSQVELDAMEISPADIDQVSDAGFAWSSDRVVDTTDSFLDKSQIQPLAEIPTATGVGTTGLLDDLGTIDITGATDSLSRPGSFRRSRITTPSNRIFNLANLFRPTLSPGISL